MSDKNDKSKLAQAVEAARGHPDPERDIPLMNQVAKVLKTTNSERQVVTMERAVFDAFREGFMVGSANDGSSYELRVARAEGKANAYYDQRRERIEVALLSQVERMRERMEAIADVPDGYHDCSDYERGYGDARAATRAMIRVALKDIFP